MQQEKQAAIDRQNQVIVSQLMRIKQSPARVDNWNTQWKPRFLPSHILIIFTNNNISKQWAISHEVISERPCKINMD